MSYSTFYNVFLTEMPRRVNGNNSFAAQLVMIRENLQYNSNVIKLEPDVWKTQNGDQITYWAGTADASTVQLIVDTEQHGSFRKVILTSKNPQISAGNPPFAGDLYVIIKEDALAVNLVFTSDEFLSDSGIKLWQNIVTKGYKVAVYDTLSRQYVLSQVTKPDDMLAFLGDADKRKYIFVMSESTQHIRAVIHSFSIMDLKRQAGYPLFENYENK